MIAEDLLGKTYLHKRQAVFQVLGWDDQKNVRCAVYDLRSNQINTQKLPLKAMLQAVTHGIVTEVSPAISLRYRGEYERRAPGDRRR